MFITGFGFGMVAVNISDLSIVGRAPRKNEIARRSAASDSVLGVAEYVGVEFYSIAQTDSIANVTFFPSGGQNYGIAKRGNIAYVASSYAGLWSVDFSDAHHPKAISNIHTPDYSLDVVLTDNVACVLAKGDIYPFHDSVVVVHIDDSGSLTRFSSFATDINATSIAVRDTLVVVGADSAVGIFSIADPLHPYRMSTWKQPGIYLSVSVSGIILAVGARVWDAGLWLIDISDPALPKQLSYVPMDILTILLKDTVAFMESNYMQSSGFHVFSVSNPFAPFQIGEANPGCYCSTAKIVLGGEFVYALGESVQVFDISDLSLPAEVTSLFLPFPYGAAASHDTLFVATSDVGVWVLKNNLVTSVNDNNVNLPVSFQLFDNSPNPFNPSTTIHYQLPVDSRVTLKVFDVLGQEVATLVNEAEKAGRYEVEFNGSKLSSGVYFYRLSVSPSATRDLVPTSRDGQADGISFIQKMILAK